MPVYEFRCEQCGRTFEERQSIEEHAQRAPACPQCKSDRVERLFSSFHAVTTRKA